MCLQWSISALWVFLLVALALSGCKRAKDSKEESQDTSTEIDSHSDLEFNTDTSSSPDGAHTDRKGAIDAIPDLTPITPNSDTAPFETDTSTDSFPADINDTALDSKTDVHVTESEPTTDSIDTEGELASDTDAMVNGACTDVRCNTPPNPACNSEEGITVYSTPGWCSNGVCTYPSRDEPCGAGKCANGKCSESPCQGITCNKPPSAECVDSENIRIYNRTGHCIVSNETPTCDYASTIVACTGGCRDGKCADDPCDNVRCIDPPARYCDQGDLMVAEDRSRCEDGVCIYEMHRMPCGSAGCSNGQCNDGDLCDEVYCLTPPAAYCVDNTTLRSFRTYGSCADGGCYYEHDTIPCPIGCSDGMCVDDPCAGVSCDQSHPSFCRDDNTLIHWAGGGPTDVTCVDGVCIRDDIWETECQNGCRAGVCTNQLCVGVYCGSVPAPSCADNTQLRTHEAGACELEDDGTAWCHSVSNTVRCTNGCEAGVCVP